VTAPWNPVPPPAPAAPALPPAPVGTRIGAFVVDYLVAMVAASPVIIASVQASADAVSGVGGSAAPNLGLMAVGYVLLIAVAIFQIWSEGARGGSIGKRALGLRVVLVETAQLIGVGRAFLRGIVRGLPLVVLTPLFNDQRRGLHDLAVGSIVTTADAVRAGGENLVRQRASELVDAPAPFTGSVPPAPPAWSTPTAPPPTAPPPPVPAFAEPPAPPVEDAVGAAPLRERPVPPPPTGFYGTPTGSVPVVRPGHGASVAPVPPPPVPSPPVPVPSVPPVPPPPVPPVPSPPVDEVPAVPSPPPAPDLPDPSTPAPEVPLPGTPDPDVPLPGATPGPPALRLQKDGPDQTGVTPVLPPPPDTWSSRSRPATVSPAPVPIAPPSIEETPSAQSAAALAPEEDDFDDSTRIAPARRLAARPPHALLHLSDGRDVRVASTVLIGRKPTRTPERQVDQLLPVADPGRSLSKSHVLVGVDTEGVWVADQHSTNGTVITLPDGQQIICGALQVVRLPEGAVVSVGDLTIRAELVPAGGAA